MVTQTHDESDEEVETRTSRNSKNQQLNIQQIDSVDAKKPMPTSSTIVECPTEVQSNQSKHLVNQNITNGSFDVSLSDITNVSPLHMIAEHVDSISTYARNEDTISSQCSISDCQSETISEVPIKKHKDWQRPSMDGESTDFGETFEICEEPETGTLNKNIDSCLPSDPDGSEV